MTATEVRNLQRSLNAFTKKFLAHVTALRVDGKKGRATNKRIKMAKWELGYVRKRCTRTAGPEFRARLGAPRSVKTANRFIRNPTRAKRAVRRGIKRRHVQRRNARRNQFKSYLKPGVTRFDGVPVAKVAVPILRWCRANGWNGRLVSGWRDPNYSRSLCYRMCGRPSCSGTCAGTASNHVGNSPVRFALDVSDYYNFANVVARCPVKPRIYNRLPRDRVHFAPGGV